MTVDKLAGLHPDLVSKIGTLLAAMATLGFPMRVVQGLRTTEEQKALFAQGRTTPGSIVTKADGVVNRSNHQAAQDGLGRAADCAFVVGGKVVWDGPWAAYGANAMALGLVWGGNFRSIVDRPHVELPKV